MLRLLPLCLLVPLVAVCARAQEPDFAISVAPALPGDGARPTKTIDELVGLLGRAQRGEIPELPDEVRLEGVPRYDQRGKPYCGLVGMMMVLAYYGIEPEGGVERRNLEFAARYKEFIGWQDGKRFPGVTFFDCQRFLETVYGRYGTAIGGADEPPEKTLPLCRILLAAGVPVLIGERRDNDGHLVVMTGYDREKLWFQDPWGKIYWRTVEGFFQRWRDQPWLAFLLKIETPFELAWPEPELTLEASMARLRKGGASAVLWLPPGCTAEAARRPALVLDKLQEIAVSRSLPLAAWRVPGAEPTARLEVYRGARCLASLPVAEGEEAEILSGMAKELWSAVEKAVEGGAK